MIERTLAVIKPDAVATGHIGDIITRIEHVLEVGRKYKAGADRNIRSWLGGFLHGVSRICGDRQDRLGWLRQ